MAKNSEIKKNSNLITRNDDTIVSVVLGDGLTANWNVRNPVATTFRGPNAPEDAKKFLEEKIPSPKSNGRSRKTRNAKLYDSPTKRHMLGQEYGAGEA